MTIPPSMGDANPSIPTANPFFGSPMWGAHPVPAARSSVRFVPKASIDCGIIAKIFEGRACLPSRSKT